jgi:hypothetical protein
MTGAPWYVTDKTIHDDLNIPYITDEIKKNEPTDTEIEPMTTRIS